MMTFDRVNIQKILESPYFIYVLVTLFFLFKLNHLNIQYYWDELGVYSKASLYMYDHGITLFPGVIPAELSRGHPLLFAAIFGSMYKILGPHIWVGHITAIIFSCLLLIALYRLGRETVGKRATLVATVVMMVQPVFVAQSGMVLPEVMLAFFCISGILSYLKRQYLWLACWGTLAIMTKETAIALPAAIMAVEIISLILDRKYTKENTCMVASALFPLLIWGIFLVAQKYQEGWYFFPLHTGYVSFSLDQVYARSCYYLSFIFKGQGRYLWALACVVSIVILYFKSKKTVMLDLALILRNDLSSKAPWYIFCIFAIMGLLASALNFHLARYTLFFLPLICLLVVKLCFHLYQNQTKFIASPLLFGIVIVPFFYYEADVFTFDADMGFRNAVKTQKLASDFINENYDNEVVIVCEFPMSDGLLEPRAGYTSQKYKNILNRCGRESKTNADLFIYTYPGNLESCNPDTSTLALVEEFKSSFSKVYIYRKDTSGSESDLAQH